MSSSTRGRGQGESAGGEGYLASVGDLMSAVLFVFIITVVVFAVQLARETKAVGQAVRGNTEARNRLIHEISEKLSGANFSVEVDSTQGVLRLPEKVVFRSASDTLGIVERQNVALLAKALGDVLPAYCLAGGQPNKLEAVFIEGHADSLNIHTRRFRDNLELSAARAHTVYTAFMESDPRLGALYNADSLYLFSASGYGDRRLIDHRPTPEGQARNRRIDLRFVMASPKNPAADVR